MNVRFRVIAFVLLCAFSATLSLRSYAAPPTSGLVTYYSFENNLLDSSGVGNHGAGTLVGFGAGATEYGEYGGSFSTGSFLVADAAINPASSFTVSVWVSPGVIRLSQPMAIIEERNAVGDGLCGHPLVSYPVSCANYGLSVYEGKFAFNTSAYHASESTPIQIRIFAEDPAQAENLYHIVGRYNDSNGVMDLWVNGALAAEATVGTVLNVQPDSILRIGKSVATNDQSWIGMIDEVRIYNRALSDYEIVQFSAAPVSEADAYALMALGLSLVGFLARRKAASDRLRPPTSCVGQPGIP